MEIRNQAENPALFFAGCLAYDAFMDKRPSGYPVSFDATSSGMQILAAVTGDRLAASICNVIDSGKREDSYTAVFERMVDVLMERLGEAAGRISRDDCKQAIMTSLYGSEATPKEVFGEGAQLMIFYDVMLEMAPGAWELNQYFLDIWDPTVLEHNWIMPDNFHVKVKVMDSEQETVHFLNDKYDTFYKKNAPKEKGRSLGANFTHSVDGMIVREITGRCMYDPQRIEDIRNMIAADRGSMIDDSADGKMVDTLWGHYMTTGFLSVRILKYLNWVNIDSVDRNVILDLINSLPKKPFQVVAVHDCFRCLPGYVNDLRKQYNLQLHLLAKSKVLESILFQMTGRKMSIAPLDPTLADDILEANYALS
ncbi:MAG: RNA polymerase [Podoviridae sp. ctda_1]|nr:MAG: RNA polymerase [Podoviridae sp. ctda_1]